MPLTRQAGRVLAGAAELGFGAGHLLRLGRGPAPAASRACPLEPGHRQAVRVGTYVKLLFLNLAASECTFKPVFT